MRTPRKHLAALLLSLLPPAPAAGAGLAPSVAAEAAALPAGGETTLVVRVAIPAGLHANANPASAPYLIPLSLSFAETKDIAAGPVVYPPGEVRRVAGGMDFAVYEGTVTLRAALRAAPDARPGLRALPFVVRYQLCDTVACYRPGEVAGTARIEVQSAPLSAPPPDRSETAPGSAGNGSAPAETARGAAASSGASPAPPAEAIPSAGGLDLAALERRGGFFLLLAGFLLIGILLNASPCVYPVLPITLGYFGGGARGRTAPLRYGAGLALVFAVLGLAAAAGGVLLGAWLQHPAVLAAAAAVVAAFGAASLGWIPFRLPARLERLAARANAGPFALGATAGLVAAPCVGPLVAGALVFLAARENPPEAFAATAAMGIGMALPQVLLAYGVLRLGALPKSGAWTEWTKKAMGLLLFGAAIWLVHPILGATRALALGAIWALLSGAYIGWFSREEGGAAFRWTRRAAGLAYILLGARFLLALEAPARPPDFAPFRPDALGGRIAMVDVRADWCVPCLDLERYTFSDPRVREAFRDFALFRLDVTRPAEGETAAFLDAYDVLGVPTVLFFDERGREIEDERLLGYEPADRFLERLERVRRKARRE